mmetsp:Transcript_13143/g.20151  ORF Transcript_13143/g.20151 Transcript_13143/m.20151 type:complete len:276 (+) Transcript_13143:527-1354(+)
MTAAATASLAWPQASVSATSAADRLCSTCSRSAARARSATWASLFCAAIRAFCSSRIASRATDTSLLQVPQRAVSSWSTAAEDPTRSASLFEASDIRSCSCAVDAPTRSASRSEASDSLDRTDRFSSTRRKFCWESPVACAPNSVFSAATSSVSICVTPPSTFSTSVCRAASWLAAIASTAACCACMSASCFASCASRATVSSTTRFLVSTSFCANIARWAAVSSATRFLVAASPSATDAAWTSCMLPACWAARAAVRLASCSRADAACRSSSTS